jgi:hypothetical protein
MLDDLYKKAGRASFCLFLERFWDKFAWNWELLLTGNPIVEIYNGIKLSAGGELGIGVGEEEWGSGEREVLEDFVTRTEGLVDLVVSRFGDSSIPFDGSPASTRSIGQGLWLGSDNDPRPSDGVVFSGAGGISRLSLARVSQWMEWIYRFGDATYGVGRDPTSLRRRKPKRQRARPPPENQPSTPDRSFTPGIPRPLVTATPQPLQETPSENDAEAGTDKNENPGFPTETVMKYLTLGYGSAWSFSPKSATPVPSRSSTPGQHGATSSTPTPQDGYSAAKPPQVDVKPRNNPSGRFVLGPRDDLETLDDLEEGSPDPETENGKPQTRILQRTLYVHLANGSHTTPKELQAVIYVVSVLILKSTHYQCVSLTTL